MAYGTWLVGIAGLGWGWTWCSFQPKPFNGSVIQGGLLPAVSCPWLASKPSCGSSALPSEELSFSGSKDTSSFSKGHFSSKAAEQTTRSRRQPAHRKKQSHSLSEGDSTRTGCCEDWTPSPTILAFTVQAVTWWPVSSGICVGPWCKDAGSTLGATGTFIHGKAAARNHLGSKTPMTPERKMLNVLPLLLPKKGGGLQVWGAGSKQGEAAGTQINTETKTLRHPNHCSLWERGDDAEHCCGLCQMAPGLYATLTAACKETENRICHPPSTAFCWIRVGTAPRYPFYIPHPFQHSMDTQRHPDPSSGSSKSTQHQQLLLLKKETNQPTNPPSGPAKL